MVHFDKQRLHDDILCCSAIFLILLLIFLILGTIIACLYWEGDGAMTMTSIMCGVPSVVVVAIVLLAVLAQRYIVVDKRPYSPV